MSKCRQWMGRPKCKEHHIRMDPKNVEKWRVISWDRPLTAAKNSVRSWSRCKRQQWTVPVRSTCVHYYFDLGLPNFFDNERDIVTAAAIYCTCNLKVTRGAREHLALGRYQKYFMLEFPSFLLLTK